jgi:hypothetical protein
VLTLPSDPRSEKFESDFSSVVLPRLPDVPGMIREADCRYYYWLGSRAYSGRGAVVEVGTWLGRSTIHLAAGLRDGGRSPTLHCFDRYVWDRQQAAKTALPLEPGDDFQPWFERNVRPIYPHLRVSKVDVNDLVWDGGPIEILLFDAPKRLREFSSALAAFGPWLIPGVTIIVFQDYQHFPSYALPALLHKLKGQLDVLHVVLRGSSVSFVAREAIRADLAQPLDWNFHRWSVEDAMRVWEEVLAPLGEEPRRQLAPGLAMLLLDIGEPAAACNYVRSLPDDKRTARQWHRFAQSQLYDRYRPLFDAAGVRRSRFATVKTRIARMRGGSPRRRLKTLLSERRMAASRWLASTRKRFRRAWRTAYQRSRATARRVLTAAGFERLLPPRRQE